MKYEAGERDEKNEDRNPCGSAIGEFGNLGGMLNSRKQHLWWPYVFSDPASMVPGRSVTKTWCRRNSEFFAPTGPAKTVTFGPIRRTSGRTAFLTITNLQSRIQSKRGSAHNVERNKNGDPYRRAKSRLGTAGFI
jgi:hypothetical protein